MKLDWYWFWNRTGVLLVEWYRPTIQSARQKPNHEVQELCVDLHSNMLWWDTAQDKGVKPFLSVPGAQWPQLLSGTSRTLRVNRPTKLSKLVLYKLKVTVWRLAGKRMSPFQNKLRCEKWRGVTPPLPVKRLTCPSHTCVFLFTASVICCAALTEAIQHYTDMYNPPTPLSSSTLPHHPPSPRSLRTTRLYSPLSIYRLSTPTPILTPSPPSSMEENIIFYCGHTGREECQLN